MARDFTVLPTGGKQSWLLGRIGEGLNFAAFKEIVLFAAGAVCALEAADKENSNAYGGENRHKIRVHPKPVK